MPEIEVSDFLENGPVTESSGGYRLYPVYPFEADKNFEIYYVEIDPGSGLESPGHVQGVQEFIIVNQGSLDIAAEGGLYSVKSGQSITFNAEKGHSYSNSGSTITKAVMMLYYKN